jgi:hypothetical protein
MDALCARAAPAREALSHAIKDRIVDDLLFGPLAGNGVVRVGVDPESDRPKFASEGRRASEAV